MLPCADSRSKLEDILMAEIKKHIKRGTTIYSDSWPAYNTKELEK